MAVLPANPPADTRFDRRLAGILEHATDVFYEKGFQGASMRDLSRATGLSLAGLYYYFDSKDRLLYLVQKHTFTTILEHLRERLLGVADPEQRVCTFISNHLEYFLANLKAMTVLAHEDQALKNSLGEEIAAIKREYYQICVQLLEELKRARGLEFSPRIAAVSLFGMMNWIYTWHNPRLDADSSQLSREMADIFLRGLLSAPKTDPAATSPAENSAAARRKPASPNGKQSTVRSKGAFDGNPYPKR